MIKYYMSTVFSAWLLTVSSFTIEAQETLAMEVKFENTSPASIDGTYCGGNIEISSDKLESREVTDKCFGVLGQITRSSLYFNGDVNYNNKDFSYIVIKNTGDLPISKIVLKGVSHSGSNAFLSVESSESSNPGENDYEVEDNLMFPADATGVECRENTVGDGYWSDMDIKTIRLMHSNRYQSMNLTNPPRPCIQSLEIWTVGSYTSVPKAGVSGFQVYSIHNELYFTESVSEVSVYSISGQQVQSGSNVKTLSIHALPSGIYVVKAVNKTGEILIDKIVR